MEASRSLPQRYDLAILYPKSESLQSHLTEYNIVVVQICHRFRSYVQSSTLRKITSSLNDADIKEFQSKLVSWSKSIGEEIIFLMASRTEEEAQQNSRFRDLMIKASKTATRQQKLSAFQRVLSLCSTFDHETCWKQIRKSGNTSMYAQIAEYDIWKKSSRLSDPRSNCLIFCAQIGYGKSVMLANIVDDIIIHCESKQASVAYFFCKHDLPKSLKARTILGVLTRQIIGQFFNNFDFGMAPDEPTIGYDVMINLIKQVVPAGHILFFILDGLDLCDLKEQESVVKQLKNMSRNVIIRPCISLRLGPDARSEVISAAFPQATIVSQVDNTGDIEAYINEELTRCVQNHELIVGDPLLILKVCEALSSGSRGMFLWVVLMIKELCLLKTDEEISNALSNLPKDLSEIYKKILQRSSLRSTKHESRIFQLITAAQRPLTTEELREALSVQPGDTDWTATKLINDIHSLLASCGCLLIVEEEEHCIRFVHPSVQQFFLDHYEDAEDSIITLETCHRMMADILVTYLSYTIFGTELSTFCVPKIDIGSAPTKVIESTTESSKSAQALALKLLKLRKLPEFDMGGVIAKEIQSHKGQQRQVYHLVEYARENYLTHISKTQDMGLHVTKLLPKLLIRDESQGSGKPRPIEAYKKAIDHENMTMMKIADSVYRGTSNFAFPLADPSGKTFVYTALGLAICQNREKIIEQRNGIFSKDSPPLSMFLIAPCEVAFSGNEYHIQVMKKVSKSPALPRSFCRHICFSGRNLLACAVWGENKEMIQYLFSIGEWGSFGEPFERSAVWEAIRKGDAESLKLFLQGRKWVREYEQRMNSFALELGNDEIIQLVENEIRHRSQFPLAPPSTPVS